MTSTAAGVAALAAGLAYLGLGLITGYELVSRFRSHGLSRFGLALLLMFLTCGAHHVEHALHVLFEGQVVSGSVVVGQALALVPAVVFVGLRVQALLGGAGERFVTGTPGWFAVLPWLAAAAVGAALALAARDLPGLRTNTDGWPSLMLAGAYLLVGVLMIRTQLMRRRARGGWSLSGTSLAAVFPTCALNHLLVAPHAGAHLFAVDLVAVPASAFFLWQTHLLYREAVRDWNRTPLIGHPARAGRRSPWAPVPQG